MEIQTRIRDNRGGAAAGFSQACGGLPVLHRPRPSRRQHLLTDAEVRWIAFRTPGRVDSGNSLPGQELLSRTRGGGLLLGLPGPSLAGWT